MPEWSTKHPLVSLEISGKSAGDPLVSFLVSGNMGSPNHCESRDFLLVFKNLSLSLKHGYYQFSPCPRSQVRVSTRSGGPAPPPSVYFSVCCFSKRPPNRPPARHPEAARPPTHRVRGQKRSRDVLPHRPPLCPPLDLLFTTSPSPGATGKGRLDLQACGCQDPRHVVCSSVLCSVTYELLAATSSMAGGDILTVTHVHKPITILVP